MSKYAFVAGCALVSHQNYNEIISDAAAQAESGLLKTKRHVVDYVNNRIDDDGGDTDMD